MKKKCLFVWKYAGKMCLQVVGDISASALCIMGALWEKPKEY
jgi:hypothetical protein